LNAGQRQEVAVLGQDWEALIRRKNPQFPVLQFGFDIRAARWYRRQ
jgi:hypothetical protein